MSEFTRRQFIRWLTLQLLAVASGKTLSACGLLDPRSDKLWRHTSRPELKPSTTASAEGSSEDAISLTQTPPLASPDLLPTPTMTLEPASYPDLGVARGKDPGEITRLAVMALGGMERFVTPGDDVIVKPNICVAYRTYKYAATTNPWVVGALVRMVLEAGAKRVRVMDYPFSGSAKEAYVRSGIQKQVRAAGGEMEPIARFKFVQTKLPEAKDLKKCYIHEDVLNADVLINVPIAKHHGLARLTLGMKNLMGVIRDRPRMHSNLGQRLADLTSRVRPSLTVVDAVRILMRHGPSGGNLADVKKLNTVIASLDIVAADSYAATLFGVKPNRLSYVVAGTAMGLGRSDLKNLRIEEINADA